MSSLSARSEDPTQAVEATLVQVDRLMNAGRYVLARSALSNLIQDRFSHSGGLGCELFVADALAVEKLADIAVLFGEIESADDLLNSLAAWYSQAGNHYQAAYLLLKRIHLLVGENIEDAYDLLRSLVPDVDYLRITPEGLLAWESHHFGKEDDSSLASGHRTGAAVWRTRDADQTVIVAGEAGYGADGRAYVWVEGSSTAVPRDEIVFDTPLFVTGIDRVLLVSSLHLEMGRILSGFGQYGDALTVLGRSLSITSDAPESFIEPVTFHLRLAIAEAHLQKGDLDTAQQHLDSLRQKLDAALYPGLYVHAEELLGKLDLILGRFGAALGKFENVFLTCERLGFAKAALIASLNRAHSMIYLNQTARAREILNRVRDTAAERGDNAVELRACYLIEVAHARGYSLAEGVAISPSVTARWRRPQNATPEAEVRSTPPDLPAVADFLCFFEDRALGFHWLLGNGDLEETARYLRDITKVFKRSDSKLIRLRLWVMWGMLLYYKRRYARAATILARVVKALSLLGMEPELWQAQRFLQWCRQKIGRTSNESLAPTEATETLLNKMADSLAPEDRAIFLLNKWTAEEEFLASEIEVLAALKNDAVRAHGAKRWIRRWRVMKRLHKLLVYVDQYKARAAGEALSGTKTKPGKLERKSLLRTLLGHPRNRHTIAFLVLPDRVFVASIGYLSLDFGVSPLTRLDLRNDISYWHDPRVDRRSRDLSMLPGEVETPSAEDLMELQRRTSACLAENLQISDIVESLDRRVSALTIVPDDSLHAFPFGALVHRDQYLIERYPITLSFHVFQRKTARQPPFPDALMVGVSKESQSEECQFPGLPGTLEELNRLEPLFKEWAVNVRRMDDGGQRHVPARSTVLTELGRTGLAHIACHGTFRLDRPDQSGMLLLVDGQPELLSLRDLTDLNLSRLRHITLSACWLTDAFVLPTRRVISLPETLLRAGAGSVLGNLWPINDSLAVQMMEKFYKELRDKPPDAALQAVQVACLQGGLCPGPSKVTASEPFHWAGLCLYGNVDPMFRSSRRRSQV